MSELERVARSWRVELNRALLPYRTEWEGETWLVAPAVMLQEGVVEGSLAEGPEFIPAEELFAPAWNGRPVSYYHPTDADGYTANSPATWERIVLGHVFNAAVEDGKLKGELWIRLAKAERLGEDVRSAVAALEAGEPVDVSTGYWAVQYEEPGEFGGRAYEYVTRFILPDHLAILPGSTGACSWADGCGAPRVNGRIRERQSQGGTNVSQKSGPAPEQLRQLRWKFARNNLPQSSRANEQGLNDLRWKLDAALEQLHGWDWWMVEWYPDRVIYTVVEYKTYQRPYSLDEAGNVVLGEPVEVSVSYETTVTPVANDLKPPVPAAANPQADAGAKPCGCGGAMNKKEELIKRILGAKGGRFNEKDRPALEALDEALLEKLAPAEQAPEPQAPAAPAANAQPPAPAPAEPQPQPQAALNYDELAARLEEARERKALVAKITANSQVKAEELEGASLPVLRELAARYQPPVDYGAAYAAPSHHAGAPAEAPVLLPAHLKKDAKSN